MVVALIFLCLWWAGDKYKADLSSDIPDYTDGGSQGHPIWP